MIVTAAGEIQHTTVHPSTIVRRHKALTKAGDRVVWTTDRNSSDVTFLRRVPHLAVPALDDHRLYFRARTPHLTVISGWTLFEAQRCGWADMWQGITRCPVADRLIPCDRLHLYPTPNPHAYHPNPDAQFPCGPRPDLDHLLEGILTDTWRPYSVNAQLTTWIPVAAYDQVVSERGTAAWRDTDKQNTMSSQQQATRVCEQNATSSGSVTPAPSDGMPTENLDSDPYLTCCGLRHAAWAGLPLQLGCQLCRNSPTYWRPAT